MSLLSLAPAILLALCGAALIAFILWALLHNFMADSRSWATKRKLARRQRLVQAADEFLKAGDIQKALPLLRESFLFDSGYITPVLVESLGHHHLAIVSRLIAIAERNFSHVPNLAIVEDLLTSRVQIMRAQIEAKEGKRLMRQKTAKAGKDLPDWAINEFQKKIIDLNDKLATNKMSLDTKLGEVFESLQQAPSSQEVTYH